MNQTRSGDPTQIRSASGDQYLIVPENEDRFVLTSNEVVRACQAYSNAGECVAQYRDLVEHLIQFTRTYRSRIERALLTVRTRDILFLVVSSQAERDDELSDEVTEFELFVAGKEAYSILRFCALCLPLATEAETAQFLSKIVLDITELADASGRISSGESQG